MVIRCRNAAPLLILAFTVAAVATACGRPPATADSGESGTDTTTEDTSCVPGEPACECNDGLCLAGLECVDNICESPECNLGELGCECNDGLCLSGLECVAGICTEPGGDGDGDGDGDLCGNGDIDLGEQCDDANDENGDGCNNDCTGSGALLWDEVFTVYNELEYANGVAVDSSDQIFVSGIARVVGNDIDGWYRKYSPDGQLFWHETYDGPAAADYSPDGCYRIAVDPDDDILVACWSHDVGTDAMLRKVDQNGAEIWTRIFDVLGDDNLYGVAAAADGTIVVSGQATGNNAFVRRFDAGGTEIWTRTFTLSQRGREVGYTADGDIAVAFDPGRYVRLYSTGGNEVWTYSDVTGNALGLAIDGNDVLLAGDEMNDPVIGWFGRLDPNGGLSWDETFTGNGNTMYAYSQDIAVDSAGRIIVVGARNVFNQGMTATTRKYSPDGQTLIWEQTLQGNANGSNGATSVAIDSQDNVIVCGLAQGDLDFDAFVVKYAP
jgi:cysteine-rich repeat protein